MKSIEELHRKKKELDELAKRCEVGLVVKTNILVAIQEAMQNKTGIVMFNESGATTYIDHRQLKQVYKDIKPQDLFSMTFGPLMNLADDDDDEDFDEPKKKTGQDSYGDIR